MPVKYHDISGNRYGRLVAIRRVSEKWEFKCDCGNVKFVLPSNVKRGHTLSCGCLHRETAIMNGRAHKHGYTGTAEYRAWSGMHQRCSNVKSKNYNGYGGRGIKVCDQWSAFESFIHDIGKRPSILHSIDRIDVNGDYDPSNCRWATIKEQNANRRTNVRVNAFGKDGCLADFIWPHTKQYRTALKRIREGRDPKQVILDMIGIFC